MVVKHADDPFTRTFTDVRICSRVALNTRGLRSERVSTLRRSTPALSIDDPPRRTPGLAWRGQALPLLWQRLPLVYYLGNIPLTMTIAHSKLTAQGQISVPAEVRRRLGIGPGSILEWDEDGEQIVVRRAGRYTSEEVHRALFPQPPKPRTLAELKEGVRRYMKGRYARR